MSGKIRGVSYESMMLIPRDFRSANTPANSGEHHVYPRQATFISNVENRRRGRHARKILIRMEVMAKKRAHQQFPLIYLLVRSGVHQNEPSQSEVERTSLEIAVK